MSCKHIASNHTCNHIIATAPTTIAMPPPVPAAELTDSLISDYERARDPANPPARDSVAYTPEWATMGDNRRGILAHARLIEGKYGMDSPDECDACVRSHYILANGVQRERSRTCRVYRTDFARPRGCRLWLTRYCMECRASTSSCSLPRTDDRPPPPSAPAGPPKRKPGRPPKSKRELLATKEAARLRLNARRAQAKLAARQELHLIQEEDARLRRERYLREKRRLLLDDEEDDEDSEEALWGVDGDSLGLDLSNGDDEGEGEGEGEGDDDDISDSDGTIQAGEEDMDEDMRDADDEVEDTETNRWQMEEENDDLRLADGMVTPTAIQGTGEEDELYGSPKSVSTVVMPSPPPLRKRKRTRRGGQTRVQPSSPLPRPLGPQAQHWASVYPYLPEVDMETDTASHYTDDDDRDWMDDDLIR
jgi:hypothetical protein